MKLLRVEENLGPQKDWVARASSASEKQPSFLHMLICKLLAWALSVKPWPTPTPKTTGITSINISHLPLITCSLKNYLFPETLGLLLSVIGSYCRDHPTLVHIALQPGSFAGVEVPTVSTDAYLLNM